VTKKLPFRDEQANEPAYHVNEWDLKTPPLLDSEIIAGNQKGGDIMKDRRQFLRIVMGVLAGSSLWFNPFFSALRWAYGKVQKTILPKGTKRETLVNRDPKTLDTRNLDTTPLKDFGTMGTSDYEVNLDEWRLEIGGRMKNPLRLTYAEILNLPAIEKEILLICPGFFANHGRWKGISMKSLLEKAGVKKDARRVSFRGPKGSNEKVGVFPVEDVLADKVFLAYGVNGQTLPKEHWFPLRVVAEDYYGNDWVKYVYKVNTEES
jgi:DMSO/TMAO reductase YedYZ molybdopterin-dependent catalytic subunit